MRILLSISALAVLFSCKEPRDKTLIKNPERLSAVQIACQDSAISNLTDTADGKWKTFKTNYRFYSFPADVYSGKLVDADFSAISGANDPQFQERFIRQMDSINFAGHFTIVFINCGAMCSNIFIVDRKTGKIYSDLPVNKEGRWGFKFRKGSRLLIANSELIENDTLSRYGKIWQIDPELYVWTGKKLRRLH